MEVKKLSLKEIGYKKLILIFLAGVLLIFLSIKDFVISDKDETDSNAVIKDNMAKTVGYSDNSLSANDYVQFVYETEYYEKKLKELVVSIKGVSDAAVMITLEHSSEKVVLKDVPGSVDAISETDGSGGTRESKMHKTDEHTVLVSGSKGDSVPYVTKELNAQISGVVILIKAEGEIDKYQISQAIESLFNIQSHRINILEMK